MLHALRSLALALLLLATSAGAAEVKPFAREDMASDAVRLTETLRIATAAIGAQVKGKTPDQLRKEAAAASAAVKLRRRRKARGRRRSPPLPRTPPTGSLTRASRSRPTTRRRTTVMSSSPAGRPPPTPPICARRRRTRRPLALAVLADLLARHEHWRPALDALEGVARPARLNRRAQDLRGDARRARVPHSRLQGRQRIDLAARLLQLSPRRSRARRTSRPMSRFPGRPTPRSRTRTSRFASRASSTASATRSCCAKACPRRSASSF